MCEGVDEAEIDEENLSQTSLRRAARALRLFFSGAQVMGDGQKSGPFWGDVLMWFIGTTPVGCRVGVGMLRGAGDSLT